MLGFGISFVVLVALVVKGVAIIALTYIGARLAIRHERGTSR